MTVGEPASVAAFARSATTSEQAVESVKYAKDALDRMKAASFARAFSLTELVSTRNDSAGVTATPAPRRTFDPQFISLDLAERLVRLLLLGEEQIGLNRRRS